MPQSAETDRALVKGPPPLFMVIPLVLGVLVENYLYSLPFGSRWVGLVPALGGLLLGFYSIRQFVQAGESVDPGEPNNKLLQTGPYRFSRNPIYLGFLLMQAGLSLLYATWWGVVLLPLTIILLQTLVIVHEEAYLVRRFGEAYTAYKGRVRRWI